MATASAPPFDNDTAFDDTATHWWPAPPVAECDVVMKGGITSGVIYPRAITELAKTYRLRGLGGASAGAIGAALGAAAELGREHGGFRKLGTLPGDLRLGELFRPQRATRQLLPTLTAVTGFTAKGVQRPPFLRWLVVLATLARSFWLAGILGALPGAALITVGAIFGGPAGWTLLAVGVIAVLVGSAIAIVASVARKLTRAVPGNMFGICSGHDDTESGEEHLTDWLSKKLDELAGPAKGAGPLLFGHLWTGSEDARAVAPENRVIDLRMVSTCLSRSRPYEMPFTTRIFYYDPEEWSKLFASDILDAMRSGTDSPAVAAQGRTLLRFPDPEKLPVIVAMRMSLSFPLLISAVPLWTANYRKGEDGVGVDADSPEAHDMQLEYEKLWFSDGGLTSNFPLYLFDSPLPTRPTFAINLGRFADKNRDTPYEDEQKNIVFARNNSERVLPGYTDIPPTGVKSLIAFGAAAINTARNWQDNMLLPIPGNRDRIVRVLQTKSEGGLNLQMNDEVIAALSRRGEVAAASMVAQFTEPRYPTSRPRLDGWVNHRWVRYRALLAGMPAFLSGYAKGKRALGDIEADQPSLRKLSAAATTLAHTITDNLDEAADAVTAKRNARSVAGLTAAPRPSTVIRRVPEL